MTLQELKDYFNDLCLSHKDVKMFLVGNNYDAATNPDNKYPLCFWEMPYTITANPDKQRDTVTVALSVFLSTKMDDIEDSHRAVSLAKCIGDIILLRAGNDEVAKRQFVIESTNAISVREFTDDYVAGVRFDITFVLGRDYCEEDIDEYFNDLQE